MGTYTWVDEDLSALRDLARRALATGGQGANHENNGRTESMSDNTLERELAATLNRHSAENASNTPDFILAQFLLGCLAAWNTGVQQRENWYGRDPRPAVITGEGGTVSVAPPRGGEGTDGE